MSTAQIVLEYLKVALSWPVVVLVIALVFFSRFQTPISALIDRIAGIRLPGGSELLMPQATMNVLNPAPPLAEEQPHQNQGEAPHGAPDAAEQRFRSERERAALWEYRYLNYFLVPRTQLVLNWLANRREPVTVSAYDAWWTKIVTNAQERLAMIDALENHYLIDIDAAHNHLIKVTPKGHEYLGWRGPVPPSLAARALGISVPTGTAAPASSPAVPPPPTEPA